jgi:hypothetical protein
MATLIFSALGTLVGGPLGGALGALAGRMVDTAIIGGGSREGPRLKELALTTSSYGTPIPRQFGQMRIAGSIIWATDLSEHSARSGGGKGGSSTTTYSYSASFAVALSSRPIRSVGRVWADGNLLRGAAGDLKVAGTFRVHTGEGDQAADPLIAAAEGLGQCPAFRGLAYVVFEDLDVADFGNRIPALTFEVQADDGALSVEQIVADVLPGCDVAVPLPGLVGLSGEGSLAETLAMLDPVYPMDCDAGARLTIARERLQFAPLALSAAAISSAEGSFGGKRGFSRKRAPETEAPLAVLRYYDPARDFQPGSQRAPGRPAPGQPRTLDLPAALDAATAQGLIRSAARRALWSRETLAWRVAELDPAIAPGAVVTVPGEAGTWRVREWEWRADGVELTLLRLPPSVITASGAVDSGRANLPPDLPITPTVLCAIELPWDGTGSGNTAALFAAFSSSSPGWTGAALFVQASGGGLTQIGSSGRNRAIMGTALAALPVASPLLFDRQGAVDIALIDPAMVLSDATPQALADEANRALLGGEIIQFSSAAALGDGHWRLSGLRRGCGGTEAAIEGHVTGEAFVLLDGSAVAFDPAQVGSAPDGAIAALGLADPAPVAAPIINRGLTLRPLAPVHGLALANGDGSCRLSWSRRARGAWDWRDGVDVPLGETTEAYDVAFGTAVATVARWELAMPELTLAAAALAGLLAASPAGQFRIYQRGDYSASLPLVVAPPA